MCFDLFCIRFKRLLILCAALTSCRSVDNIALDSVSRTLENASYDIEYESDWELFSAAMPATLKVISGFWSTSKDNLQLLATLTKGYTAYGFGVSETLYLDEKLRDDVAGVYRSATNTNYSKALYYGNSYLRLKKITFASFVDARNKGTLKKHIHDHLDPRNRVEIETLLYTMQAWASLINLNKNSAALLSHLPLVHEIVGIGCELIPDFQKGFCELFFASYEASLPPSLGGNPKRAKELFTKALNKYPDSLLVYVTYMEKLIIPLQQQDEYNLIKKQFLAKKSLLPGPPYIPGTPSSEKMFHHESALLNAIAVKRFAIINSHETKLF